MNTKRKCSSRTINSLFRRGGILAVLASVLVLFPIIAYGAAVDLAWDANSEPDLAGYKIHYGTASGDYSHSVDVRTQTAGQNPACGSPYDPFKTECCEYTLELAPGTYYLAATAYDEDGNESAYSDEMVHTVSVDVLPVGHLDYCRDFGPCAAGQGDCDNDSECEAGLTCVQVEGVDTCQTITPVCPHPVGHLDYCRDCGPCDVGQGDCDNDGECQSGLTCHLVEGVDTCQTPNNNPTTPSVPAGSSTGHTQTSYNFSTVASDPDGDALQYRFDWGDGESSDWGASSQSHSWSSANIFCIKAQAQDNKGALSAWSACRNITIAENTHTIAASAGANGSISPAGNVTVNHGSSRTFAISAGSNYHVQDVVVNGVSVGAVTSYTFSNVTQHHTIHASFAINTHTITATAGENGSISPSGSQTVNHGSSRTFAINASTNYRVQDVLVNGVSVGAVTFYTFSNVTQNHSIQARFAIDTRTITATAGMGGSISPAGAVEVNHGSDQTFTMTPADNYHIDDVLVAGISVGAVATYQFSDVSNNHTIHVIFAADEHPPVADAGADQAVYVKDTVYLDGSSSSDADGDSLTFNWSIVSKPSGSSVTLSDTQAVKPTFDVDVAGTYTVKLIVNDGTVNSAPDTVTISTENSAPVSDAGADQSVRVNDRVQLDGSGSSDVDGNSLTFTWSFVSKPSGSDAMLSNTQAVKPTFDVDVAGTYTVKLIVNDGTVNSAPQTVTISTENSAPVSDAGADQSVRVNDRVQLDGSGSSDVDGDSLTVEWSIVSKPNGSNATLADTQAVKPVFDVDVAGNYTVQLIVNDGTVNSAPDTVTISTENSAPVSHAGADQAVLVNETVQLDGSGSSDVDGNGLTFAWSFVSKPDGSNTALSDIRAVKPVFDVDVAGNYTVQLIVNDGTVNSAPNTVTISTENSTPVSHAGADQAVRVNDTAQLDGSASSDVDGDTLTFKWSFISKPGDSSATLSSTSVVRPVFDVDVAGTYTLQLIVNDGTASSAPNTVTISTENSTPVSHAGADQAVLVNDTVQLDGSASSDVDGDTLTFKWSFISKPSGSSATLTSTSVVRPVFDVDVAGTYTLQLIVNDGTASSAPDTVTISTENSAPVSHAGADQAILVDDIVQLDGSASSDADGDTLTFKWSFISKPDGSMVVLSSETTAKPSFKVDESGSYIVQLIVNDGTDNSTPDTVTIITENSAPVSNAGYDQTVEEGETVTLNGLNSTDPDENIASYTWQQTGGKSVTLSNLKGPEATFTAPNAVTDADTLTFRLTVKDTEGLQDIDTCSVEVVKAVSKDEDGDGVPDDQDDFPYDPDEYLDTDGDGDGNNADLDDDNDGMPDTWELSYGLDPLKDNAADDPDEDGISNIDEYNLGFEPNKSEVNIAPYQPTLMTPQNREIVSVTPELKTDEYYDPDIDDVHNQTQWQIIDEDGFVVYDVTTDSSLTAITVPKMILDYDTDYIWRAKFIDNHGGASEWSKDGDFTTEFSQQDSDGNGILDHQEVDDTLDLDKDDIPDREQSDIKCIVANSGNVQIGVSIRDAENVDSIMSLEIEEAENASLISKSKGRPRFIDFGLLHFKLLLNAPGEETVVTIHLSEAPFGKGKRYKKGKKHKKIKLYKYDPVNSEWLDYSKYAEFSRNRKKVYLTLKDGGFGDADGIENGIIVDPLAFGSDSDSNSGSDSDDSLIPDNISCFIAAASAHPGNMQPMFDWREIGRRELSLVFILMVLGCVGAEIFLRSRQKRADGDKRIGRIAM